MRKLKNNFLVLSFVLLSIFLIPGISVSQSYIELESKNVVIGDNKEISSESLFEEIEVDESRTIWESNVDNGEADYISIEGSFKITDFAEELYGISPGPFENTYWDMIQTHFYLQKYSKEEVISQEEPNSDFLLDGSLLSEQTNIYW